jgi:predicted HTH transcriptional regulator
MPEQQNTEYKSSWHDDYLKWVCGFANAQGGRIFIGKEDNGTVLTSSMLLPRTIISSEYIKPLL